MRMFFNSLSDFLKFKENCIFCQSKLSPILTNLLWGNGIPIIQSKLKDNYFRFKLNHYSDSISFETQWNINTNTNSIYIETKKNSFSTPKDIFKVFEDMKPHCTLQCNNKKCKKNYCISSTYLKVSNNNNTIRMPLLNHECFNLDDLWIQNDYLIDKTNIFHVKDKLEFNLMNNHLKFPIIDLSSIENEKLFNKIRTLVTFS